MTGGGDGRGRGVECRLGAMADESPAAIEREVRAGVCSPGCVRGCRGHRSFAKYPSGRGGRSPRSSRTRWRRAGRRRWRRWGFRHGRRGGGDGVGVGGEKPAELSRASSIATRPRVGEEASVTGGSWCTQLHPCAIAVSKVRVGIGSSQSPFGIALEIHQQNGTPLGPSVTPFGRVVRAERDVHLRLRRAYPREAPGARAAPPRRVGARFARRPRLTRPENASSDPRVARPASPSARRRSPSLPPLPRTP